MPTTRPKTRCRKHWYFIWRDECPVCGRERETRERRYGRRPKRDRNRSHFETVYCGCSY